MAEIDNLSIRITASADEAARIFDRLASSASRLHTASTGSAGGVRRLGDAARDTGMKMKEAGEESGKAGREFKGHGRAAEEAGKAAKRGASGIKVFWESLKRIAFYRFVRSIIKSITDAFKTGITNLYHWSSLINGHFAQSMDRLASSTLYLKNSLGALAAPLIESLVPALDFIIDKFVSLLNWFNMLIAAISGADTYTIAKKTAAVWDDSAKKTAKTARGTAADLKRTILGFDEINKLVKDTGSSGGGGSGSGKQSPNYADMFEEKPLEGIFRKIADITSNWPDWLKWLLGIGGAVGVAWGLKQLPKLFETLWDWLKKLFTINIPNWFKWLFGPKGEGGGEGTLDLPEKIEIPDADVKVNLKRGNWKPIDDLRNTTASIPVDLNKRGWTSLLRWLGLDRTYSVNIDLNKRGWTSFLTWVGMEKTYSVMIGLMRRGWKDLPSWIGTDKDYTVSVGLMKRGWTSMLTWLGLDKTYAANIGLNKRGWTSMQTWLNLDKTYSANVGLNKRGWSSMLKWLGLDVTMAAAISLVKRGWTSVQKWLGLDKTYPANVSLNKRGWTSVLTWTGLDKTYSAMISLVKRGWTSLGNWIGVDKVYSAAIILTKSGWHTIAEWSGASRGVSVGVSLLRNGWTDISNWIGKSVSVAVGLLKNGWTTIEQFIGTSVTIKVKLEKDGWNSIDDFIDGVSNSVDTFGGGAGNGGSAVGGGIVRGRRNISKAISVSVNATAGENMLNNTWGNGLTPNVHDASTTVRVESWTIWQHFGSTLMKWIGADNLKTNVTIEPWTPWWNWQHTSLINYLGLDRLATTITVTATLAGSLANLLFRREKGGIFVGGAWSDIPQYAGGTTNAASHGSMFIAGENGPEIVGHIGGRTEILNKSQIASAMYTAVRSAMSGIKIDADFHNGGMDAENDSMAILLELVQRGADATQRQNDLIRQQNDLLRRLNDKDYSTTISTADISRAQARQNRRAGTTIVPVGT